MSRRTFIHTWNPAVPIGGRGRGRPRKKGADPDLAFSSSYRTVHDPSVDPRRAAGRDAEAAARFYSASGLTATGLPAPEDRFRAQTLSTRGGRGGVQQRVGMFRNAIQSNVIFGGPSERVLRHSRRKIDRIIAPESQDVSESVNEWRPSDRRNTQRRRGAYEYDSAEEDEEEDDREQQYQPRRRVSNSRRAPEPQRSRADRGDPNYDPYEFRDDDSADEPDYQAGRPFGRPRRSNSRLTSVGGPSTSRAPITRPTAQRRNSKDDRPRPRHLYEGGSEEEEERDRERERERKERARRLERRGEERDREPLRMETRNSKRARELSPTSLFPVPAARHPVTRRRSREEMPPPAPVEKFPFSSVRFRDPLPEKTVDSGQKGEFNYTTSIATSIARRILSGIPPIRLKEDDGAESYLTASRSIIADALDRFAADEQDEGEVNDEPGEDGQPKTARPKDDNPGQAVMRALWERTQHINVSEESDNDYDEEFGSNGEKRMSFENIFSRHAREDSPVLERLFDQTMREAAMNKYMGEEANNNDEEEEVDTARMLGLADPDPAEQQLPGLIPGICNIGGDPFTIVPPPPVPMAHQSPSSEGSDHLGETFVIAPRAPVGGVGAESGTSSGSDRSSSAASHHSSHFSGREFRNYSMAAAANRSMALMGPPAPSMNQQQRLAAGSGSSSSNESYGGRSMGGGGGGNAMSRSFHFPMNGSSGSSTVRPNTSFMVNNDNGGAFDFDF